MTLDEIKAQFGMPSVYANPGYLDSLWDRAAGTRQQMQRNQQLNAQLQANNYLPPNYQGIIAQFQNQVQPKPRTQIPAAERGRPVRPQEPVVQSAPVRGPTIMPGIDNGIYGPRPGQPFGYYDADGNPLNA